MFEQLFSDPLGYVLNISLMAFPFLYGIIFHEVAHGYVAFRLGDPTAKLAGRLTLRPWPHVDIMGALLFFVLRIGWAKPVPVNPNYFKKPRQGMMIVALAGPMANFVQAVLWAIVFHWSVGLQLTSVFWAKSMSLLCEMSYLGVFINLLLAFFNLLPIPPLDGSQILARFLPPPFAGQYMSLAKYGMIFIILLAVLGLLSKILIPAIYFAFGILRLPVFS